MIRSSKRHLCEAGESYFEHLGVAGGISFGLAKASVACAVHALLPGLFTRTASRSLEQVQLQIANRPASRRKTH